MKVQIDSWPQRGVKSYWHSKVKKNCTCYELARWHHVGVIVVVLDIYKKGSKWNSENISQVQKQEEVSDLVSERVNDVILDLLTHVHHSQKIQLLKRRQEKNDL